MNRLKNPRTRFESRWNIEFRAPCPQITAVTAYYLSAALRTLPARQEIIDDLSLWRFANLLQIDLYSIRRIEDEWTVGELYWDIWVCRTKPVLQGLLLNWFGQQKIQKCL